MASKRALNTVPLGRGLKQELVLGHFEGSS